MERNDNYGAGNGEQTGADQNPQPQWNGDGHTAPIPQQSQGQPQGPQGIGRPPFAQQPTAGNPQFGQQPGQPGQPGQQGPQGHPFGQPGAPNQPGGTQPQYFGGFAHDGGVPPYQGATAPAEKKRSPRALTALGIVAAVVLAGGVGGVVGANYGGSSNSGNTILGASGGAASVPASEPTDGTVESVAEKVLPSVVSITAVGRSGGGEGSGVILSEDGKILTNNHVVAVAGQGGKIQVSFNDGSVADATVVGADAASDVAVIEVKDRNDLQPIALGSSSDLKVGQNVVAIGSPLGLSGTVTTGIVSSLNRPVMAGGAESGQSTVIDAVQTDAAINPGNSGGALVDMGGNLVGMNSAIASLGSGQEAGSIGLGFAIPVEQAQRIATQLIEQGYATRAVLGASVLNESQVLGAQIAGVERGGPAQEAGLPEDAVVTKVDDRNIESGDALVAAVRSHSPGDKVTLTYSTRGQGEEQTVEVTLGEGE